MNDYNLDDNKVMGNVARKLLTNYNGKQNPTHKFKSQSLYFIALEQIKYHYMGKRLILGINGDKLHIYLLYMKP